MINNTHRNLIHDTWKECTQQSDWDYTYDRVDVMNRKIHEFTQRTDEEEFFIIWKTLRDDDE